MRRLLLVDDNFRNEAWFWIPIVKELQELGYEVEGVAGPMEAIGKMKDWEPDLVVIDNVLSDVNEVRGMMISSELIVHQILPQKRRYARMAYDPSKIPMEQRGEFAWNKLNSQDLIAAITALRPL